MKFAQPNNFVNPQFVQAEVEKYIDFVGATDLYSDPWLVDLDGNILSVDETNTKIYRINIKTNESTLLYTVASGTLNLRKVLSSGTLLVIWVDGGTHNHKLMRSTDNSYSNFEVVLSTAYSRPGFSDHGIAQARNGNVVMAEYAAGWDTNTVTTTQNIHLSSDDGRTWEVVDSYPKRGKGANSINHFHTIEYDEHEDVFWVGTGDWDAENVIYKLSTDGKTKEFVGGRTIGETWTQEGQKWRVLCFLFGKDEVIWGMDSDGGFNQDVEPRYILRYDRHTKELRVIKDVGRADTFYNCKTTMSNGVEVGLLATTNSKVYVTSDFYNVHELFAFGGWGQARLKDLGNGRVLIYGGGLMNKPDKNEKLYGAIIKISPRY